MNETVAQLQEQGLDISRTAKLVSVTDDASLKLAGEWLKLVKDYLRAVESLTTPVIQATHAAHKAAVKQKADLLAPGLEAERRLKIEIGRYQFQQQDLRRASEEAERREAEERHRQAEQEHLAHAERALAQGDTAQAARIVQEPVPLVITSIEMPVPTKVEGITTREQWAAEVTDFLVLVKAVAAQSGQAPIEVLAPNIVELNRLARTFKGDLAIPGVKAVRSANVAVQA